MAISSEVEKLERRWTENPSGLTFAPLAEAYRKAGDQQRALEILEVGLAVHPDYIPALIVRGRCHLDAASLAEAELAFQQVLARDPANAIALRGLADLCEQGGRIPEAIERLELLLEVDRSNAGARADLARLKSTPPAGSLAASAPEPTAPAAEAEAGRWSADTTESPAVPMSEVGAEGAPAIPPVPDAPDEAPFRIENLSVDPMAANEPDTPGPEARLPWEPLEMPGWGQPAPESVEAVAETSSAEERSTEDGPRDAEHDTLLEGLIPVSDAPATLASLADAPVESLAAPAWLWVNTAASVGPGQESPAVEGEPGAVEVAPDPTAGADEPAPEVSEVGPGDLAMAIGLSSGADGVELPEEPEANRLPDAVTDGGEVAPEAAAGESHDMSHPIPPESPEAAEVAWPAVEAAEEAKPEMGVAPEEPEPADTPLVAEEVASAEAVEEPGLIVTESMAELFLRQGHRELSLAVYRQLLERSPSSESLLQAIARLEGETAARQATAPMAERPSRAASMTGGEPVGAMLQAVLASPPPVSASTVLPPAIEPVAAGEPARPGTEPLTLGQVFGDEPVVPPPATETEPVAAGEPSFDEFFGTAAAAADASTPATGPRTPEGEDMRQFTDWLKGLKR